MNATELRELAKTLIGIADGQPWQFLPPDSGKWESPGHGANVHLAICTGNKIRLKPWELTPEQIADGWLPWSGGECPVEPESRPTVMLRDGTILPVRSRASCMDWKLEATPNGGDIIAYRPDPYGKFRQALSDGRVIEYQPSVGSHWHQLDSADKIGFIAPPEAYRIKQEPQWLPLGPEDVPPGSVFRNPTWLDGSYRAATQVSPAGVYFFMNEGPTEWAVIEKHWQINRPRHRDADGNPTLWEPCRKEAK